MDIFDALMRFDEAEQAERRRLARIAELRLNSARVCGNCCNWMKSGDCPAERNVNGWNRGPSCSDPQAIFCSKFQITQQAQSAAEELHAVLAGSKQA